MISIHNHISLIILKYLKLGLYKIRFPPKQLYSTIFTTFVKTQVSYDNGKTKNSKKAERLYTATDC